MYPMILEDTSHPSLVLLRDEAEFLLYQAYEHEYQRRTAIVCYGLRFFDYASSYLSVDFKRRFIDRLKRAWAKGKSMISQSRR